LTDILDKEWIVYIIQTHEGTFYTGITVCLEKRLKEHTHTKKGAKFFRLSQPLEVVYKEVVSSRSLASKREWAIKQMTRKQKLELITKNSKVNNEYF
jgi:putative endonuclease